MSPGYVEVQQPSFVSYSSEIENNFGRSKKSKSDHCMIPSDYLNSLHTLSVGSTTQPLLPCRIWFSLLQALHRVQVIRVYCQACDHFTAAFAAVSDDRQALPNLKMIEMCNAALSYPLPGHETIITNLEKALAERTRNNAPALHMAFNYCAIAPEQSCELDRVLEENGVTIIKTRHSWGTDEAVAGGTAQGNISRSRE